MLLNDLKDCLEQTPIIAAVNDGLWVEALKSPAEVIFHLNANILNTERLISEAHENGKKLFIHLDLAEGLGRDKSGIEYLSKCGADGIISTRSQLIRHGNEVGLTTIQRFFALDSKGINSMEEIIEGSKPTMIEIMPGVIGKIIKRLSVGEIPVIAGGLIETKAEVTEALGNGAFAVSTGKKDLWYL